jgi:succinate dehydrogenase flavin-adding protein (antitoxin of CptAB toxin-antitoxin module)
MNPDTENTTEQVKILNIQDTEQKKLYYDCECGVRTMKAHKARHLKTHMENYNTLSKTELIKILNTRDTEQKKLYYDCECGVRTMKAHKARHLRSHQHKNYEATHDPTTKLDTKDIEKLSKLELVQRYLKSDVDAIIRKQAKPPKDYYCECGAKTARRSLKIHLQSEKHKAYEANEANK